MPEVTAAAEAAGNPESWSLLHVGPQGPGQAAAPCMRVKARWGGGGALIPHHPQLPGAPLHNPAARGKRAGLEQLGTHNST